MLSVLLTADDSSLSDGVCRKNMLKESNFPENDGVYQCSFPCVVVEDRRERG